VTSFAGAIDVTTTPTATRAETPAAHAHHGAALEWHDARRVAWSIGAALPGSTELVDVGAAAGRVLAVDSRSFVALPGFDSAAMDGWALGPGGGPWRIGHAVPMGGTPDPEPLARGLARAITTGGPVPSGAVAVLRSEDGDVADGLLRAIRPPAAGAHIRRTGEESASGEVLARAGDVLTPPRCALLAAGGRDLVAVRRSPRVATLTLGDEVVRRGVPAPGTVRDVFGPAVPAIVAAFGGVAGPVRAVPDDLDDTVRALEEAFSGADGSAAADIVVTTGGTAGGAGDHLRTALARLGARIVVDGVAVRPGHPVTLAMLPDGRVVLGLPGNPMAGLLCLVALGGPLLAAALGRPLPALGTATAAEGLANPTRSTRLVACITTDTAAVLPLGRQGSAMLHGLTAAEIVAIVPPGGLAAGSPVETLPLPW
jgi:molybdopterin molybdotransferase